MVKKSKKRAPGAKRDANSHGQSRYKVFFESLAHSPGKRFMPIRIAARADGAKDPIPVTVFTDWVDF